VGKEERGRKDYHSLHLCGSESTKKSRTVAIKFRERKEEKAAPPPSSNISRRAARIGKKWAQRPPPSYTAEEKKSDHGASSATCVIGRSKGYNLESCRFSHGGITLRKQPIFLFPAREGRGGEKGTAPSIPPQAKKGKKKKTIPFAGREKKIELLQYREQRRKKGSRTIPMDKGKR